MDLPLTIITVIGIITGAGATMAYFARGRGTETIKLLQNNIDAYKDSEKLKDQRIAYLEGQLITKDETIKRILND